MNRLPGNGFIERYSPAWSEESVHPVLALSHTAIKTFYYTQGIGYSEVGEDFFTERQKLHSFLILYTFSGNGLIDYQGKTFSLPTGSVILIDCMLYHYYRCPPGGHWGFLWLHFYGSSSRDYYEQIYPAEVSPFLPKQPVLFEDTLRQILSLNQKRDRFTEAITSRLIVELLTELLLLRLNGDMVPSGMPDYIRGILKEIEQNFQADLSLDHLASRIGVSKYHLSREFKKYTGTTIHELLLDVRINYATELLKYSDKTVSEITFACGMNHVSHFIRQFQKRTGLTPLAYRQQWK